MKGLYEEGTKIELVNTIHQCKSMPEYNYFVIKRTSIHNCIQGKKIRYETFKFCPYCGLSFERKHCSSCYKEQCNCEV